MTERRYSQNIRESCLGFAEESKFRMRTKLEEKQSLTNEGLKLNEEILGVLMTKEVSGGRLNEISCNEIQGNRVRILRRWLIRCRFFMICGPQEEHNESQKDWSLEENKRFVGILEVLDVKEMIREIEKSRKIGMLCRKMREHMRKVIL